MSGLDRRTTERLVLTRMRQRDFAELHAMHCDARIMATLGGVRTPEHTQRILDELAGHWDAHGFGYWMAHDRLTGAFAGRGGLRRVTIDGQPEVEIGYGFMPDYWGQGLATELARYCVQIAFDELHLPTLVCFTLPTNLKSRRVMEKVGFRCVKDIVWAELPHVLHRLDSPQRDAEGR